ncbi:MAG: DNA double-strand break repair nuclease NurA, partial [Anaerolineaceae bacterium]|nr:DNA double-strand break repair nuclease NurA [Anaerolineaceae bacterium]
VNPSRHDPVPFGVINVGVIRMVPGKAQTPQEIIESRLLILDDLYPAEGALSEEVVALRRDLYERQTLAKLAAGETGAVVTLTDGPLELFRDPSEQTLYNTLLQEYRTALHALAELNAVTAGYVDKPASDLVVRLLELTLLPEDSLNQGRLPRPLRGVADIDLFRSLLKPGERSAVFAIQSPSARHFTGALRLHFFYLNVSSGAQPYLARVEIPAWVAQNPSLLNLLHATLLSQCRQMGIHPFPYAQHRAHEVAVESREEKQQLQDLIINEVRRNGGVVGPASHKQLHKDQTGNRTRYPG